MFKSNASRIVLALLLGIAALELGISGKFAQLWALAFNPGGAAASTSGSPSGPTSGSPSSTGGPHGGLR